MTDKDKADEKKIVATHRKARHIFHISEVLEAGLALMGPEVKSLRAGRASLDGCFGRIDAGELWLENFYIPPYSFATHLEPLDPRRRRKLLVKGPELHRLEVRLKTRGFTLIPLEVYFKNGWAKVSIGLAKGKTGSDQRDDLKKKAERRDAEKSFKGAYRG
jgi:SsrA-binding protein